MFAGKKICMRYLQMKEKLYHSLVNCITENQDRFYRLAFSYVQNQEDALDAVQNAVCKALENYEKLRDEGAVKTWMYRIVVNESLGILREKKRMNVSDDDFWEDIPYEEAGFELPEDLYTHINRLDRDSQDIIKLRFYEELSLLEIAQIMEMNLNTVKSKLYRGLRSLKVSIEEAGV